MKEKPVVIIGGGLAGLACAMSLKARSVPYLLLEEKEEVGGRLSTRRHSSGFLLDEGFQVLLNSYPELNQFLDLEALNLKKFDSGAQIFDGRSLRLLANPVLHPQLAISGLLSNSVSFSDKTNVIRLIAKAQGFQDDYSYLGQSTETFLSEFGFSADFTEFFWRPFLSGVFLDESLSMDAGYFLFLIRCFGLGSVSVPAKGMSEIPKQMKSKLDADRIRTGVRILHLDSSKVTLQSGEVIEASAVVQAYNPSPASGSNYHSVETHYFSVGSPLDWDRWLILVPPKLGLCINHMALVSEVSPDYSTSGKQLLSVSVVGQKDCPLSKVIENVEKVANKSCNLEHIESVQVKNALPLIQGPAAGFREENGVFICGDHVSSPSINGALKSGRLTAQAVIQRHQFN